MALPTGPLCRDRLSEFLRTGELSPEGPIGANEVRVAELAHRLQPIFLAPCPEIAACEAAEHGGTSRTEALTL